MSKEQEVLSRPSFNRSIFLGVQEKENVEKALKVLSEAFPEHHIHIMDKDLFNKNVELFIKKNVEWKESQAILEYTNKPENIQNAISVALKIQDAVGEGWFGLKDLVDETNFTYAQAGAVLDVQYAFGFLAKKEVDGRTLYLSIATHEGRIKYVENMISSMESELRDLKGIRVKMLEDLQPKALQADRVVEARETEANSTNQGVE